MNITHERKKLSGQLELQTVLFPQRMTHPAGAKAATFTFVDSILRLKKGARGIHLFTVDNQDFTVQDRADPAGGPLFQAAHSFFASG